MERKGAYCQDLQRIKALRYMDDEFMTLCLADNHEAVALILRIVLGEEVKVKSVRVQEPVKNLYGRSAVLDVHAADIEDREFDVEIQRCNAGAGARRARYNSSLLDMHMLKPGEETETLPDSYVIFITEHDVMGGNLPLYPVERYVTAGKKRVLFGDGSHILYVNGTYRGEDEIGRLMHDFCCTDPDDMHFEALARRARHFKQDEKGVASMSRIWDEVREEGREEGLLEGMEKAVTELLEELGQVPQRVMELIRAQDDPAVLSRWIKAAAKADNIAEFEQNMNMS